MPVLVEYKVIHSFDLHNILNLKAKLRTHPTITRHLDNFVSEK